jgi:hypothetical protein
MRGRVALPVLLLLATSARADIAPSPGHWSWAPMPADDLPPNSKGFLRTARDVAAYPDLDVDVAMTSERVELDLYPTLLQVHARFEMTAGEEGETGLTVAFPELLPGVPSFPLEELTMTVDGAPAKLAVVEHQRQVPPKVGPEAERWWTTTVDFPADKTVIIEVDYWQVLSSFDSLKRRPSVLAAYVLHTGSLWRGPIGRGEVVVRAHGLGPDDELHDAERWRAPHRFENLEPSRTDDIGLSASLAERDWLQPAPWAHALSPSQRVADRFVRAVRSPDDDASQLIDALRDAAHSDLSIAEPARGLLASAPTGGWRMEREDGAPAPGPDLAQRLCDAELDAPPPAGEQRRVYGHVLYNDGLEERLARWALGCRDRAQKRLMASAGGAALLLLAIASWLLRRRRKRTA